MQIQANLSSGRFASTLAAAGAVLLGTCRRSTLPQTLSTVVQRRRRGERPTRGCGRWLRSWKSIDMSPHATYICWREATSVQAIFASPTGRAAVSRNSTPDA